MDLLKSLVGSGSSEKSDITALTKKDLMEVPEIIGKQIEIVNDTEYVIKIKVFEEFQSLDTGVSKMFPRDIFYF